MKITIVSLYNVYSYAARILHAVIEKAGYDVSSIYFFSNYEARQPTQEEIHKLVNTILEEDADIIGFTVLSPLFPLFKKIAPMLRRMTGAFILVGGHHANVAPQDCLQYANAICMGEGESAILDFLEHYPRLVPNIIIDEPYIPARPLIKDLDTIPFRAFNKDGSQTYVMTLPEYEKTTRMNVLTSRGCFFGCSFCYNHVMRRLVQANGSYYRRRSVDNVIEEIKELKKTFPKLGHIVFSDNVFSGDIFTINEKWVEEFCEKYKDIGISFRCFGHFSNIKESILKKLKDAGCEVMTLGFQSGSEEIRSQYLNKKETNKQIIETSRLIANSGILGRYDRITNIPYEASFHKEQTERLISQLARPFVLREFKLINHPSTDLTKRMLKDGHITQDNVEGNCSTAYKQDAVFTRFD